jgi:hypothetical protein
VGPLDHGQAHVDGRDSDTAPRIQRQHAPSARWCALARRKLAEIDTFISRAERMKQILNTWGGLVCLTGVAIIMYAPR